MDNTVTCKKRRYRTELDALLALSRTEAAARRHRRHARAATRGEVRSYRCDLCKAWHLTSQA